MKHNLKGTFPGDLIDIQFEEKEIGTNQWSVKLQSFVVLVDGHQLQYTFNTDDGSIISISLGSFASNEQSQTTR